MDELKNKIDGFVKKQQDAGVVQDELDESLYLLFGMAIKQTSDELNLNEHPDIANELKQGFENVEQLVDSELVKQKGEMVVNSQNETLNAVFSRNFIKIIDEFEQSLNSN